MIAFLAFAVLQQAPVRAETTPRAPVRAETTPPSGDTTGYWQQRVHYSVVATLDEEQTRLHARGTMVYVNNSPDTLREMFFHQYLNAFRPRSKWSSADDREHVERFQHLADPNYGYERFTVPPVVNGTPVVVDYPGTPDSTVAHFRLPTPLAPRDSLRVTFEWDARPSTVFRRQGRRGRTWDFAQWYPKVAVYNRLGWQPNPLIPAGELYGEFGTYDVTMVVRDDQVLASTGVPVSGDPGWARVSRTGPPFLASSAYSNVPPVPAAQVPEGYRAVRFLAENVHHFAWSASPDYRYEGGTYVRTVSGAHFPTWDTVGVHVLFKPGDDSTWGGGRALDRTLSAARWLESIWGPYAYPQITNVHRLDGGGTEFPMMVMNGSASQGLILHEFGHVFTYGILANNEWRSAWLDEGLTDYQTLWAQRLTPQERIGRITEPGILPEGYRMNGVRIPASERFGLNDWDSEVLGRTQPIGTPAYDFREFGIYNDMVYGRASLMYGQLRDVMGDSLFLAFLHDYYDRWALKHVDEQAMRVAASRVYGKNLNWFFDQWVHQTGMMDYALGGVRVNTDGSRFETIAHVEQVGALAHPISVGVQTASGWTIARADPMKLEQDVRIVTNQRPMRIELDPYHVTWDWDRRNNIQSGFFLNVREPRFAFNWPYLDQADRSQSIVSLSPAAWYTNPQGGALGIRAKASYLSVVDKYDAGVALASRNPIGALLSFGSRFQGWARVENPYVPFFIHPLMGYGAGVNFLDGILKADAYKNWDLSPFLDAPGPTINARVYLTGFLPSSRLLLPEQWNDAKGGEIGASGMYRTFVDTDSSYAIVRATIGVGGASKSTVPDTAPAHSYARGAVSAGLIQPIVGRFSQLRVRLFAGFASNAPIQRAVFASTQDPLETFNNDLFRGRGALFKQRGVNYLPLGGAGLRGYQINLPLEHVYAANGELVQQLFSQRGAWGSARVSFIVFGDAGVGSSKALDLKNEVLSDAGAGISLRGRLYDRDFGFRIDLPWFVNAAGFAGGRGLSTRQGSISARWTLTVGDLW